MAPIDLSCISAHALNDRKERFDVIEKGLGWGKPIVEAPDAEGRPSTTTLTDTGVIVIRGYDNMIITAYIASPRQARKVYERATGNPNMPRKIWLIVNYLNNTPYWQKVAA